MKTVLSVGTTHPWNIAGVGLDIRVGGELGVRVLTIVCAVSAQDAGGIRAISRVTPGTIDAQFASVPWREISAVRVGALGSAEAVHSAYAALASRTLPIVIDPVFSASRGGVLADDATVATLSQTLLTLPQAIVTPNVPEAERLLGRAVQAESMAAAAQDLQRRGSRAVLLKGGHLSGAPIDVLATAAGTRVFEASRIHGEMRGTGCVLAMALAATLASEASLEDAVHFARGFVRKKIEHAVEFGGVSAYSSADD